MRHATLVGCMTAIVPLAAGALGAQDVVPVTPRDSQAVAATFGARTSPPAAALLGLVLPGAGHWDAGEPGRGAVIAVVYWSGVAVVAGGRTDRIGLVGGIAVIGALSTSVIDGALAPGRHNVRLRVTAGGGESASRGGLRVYVMAPWP